MRGGGASRGRDFYGRKAAPSRSPLPAIFLEILCLLPLFLPLACSSSPPSSGAPRPVPALADSSAAALAFGQLRRRWAGASREERKGLQDQVLALRSAHGGEQVARLADLYLAWIALERGEYEEARRLAELAGAPHPGGVRLLAQLVEGATLARSGEPDAALDRLLPLVGQLVDPHARELLHEDAVIAAITAKRWKDVLWLLDVWLRDVPEDDQHTVLEVTRGLLGAIPVPPLEAELDRRLGSGEDRARALEKLLVKHLTSAALAGKDDALARRLLDRPGVLPLVGEEAAALLELAAQNKSPQIIGRRVGLFLAGYAPETTGGTAATPTQAEWEAAERGTQIARGALEALGSARSGGAHLLLRQTPTANATQALEGLDTEGVLLIVGGADPESAEQLARFSERKEIASLLLVPPRTEVGGRWSLLFGPSPLLAVPGLLAALARRGAQRPLLLGVDAPPPGVNVPAEPCRLLPAPGQLSRYPTAAWKARGVDALVLLGPPRCAQDVLDELKGSGFSPKVALGIEAAALLQPLPQGASPLRRPPQVTAAVGLGCFPLLEEQPPDGAPGYWERLSSEAILAAIQALEGLPDASTREAKEVRQRKELVRDALARLPRSRCLDLGPSPRLTPPSWRTIEAGGPQGIVPSRAKRE